MFDFMESDWFIITLEVVFLVLIIFDVKKYMLTKKKEYITNIVLTIGFAIWTLYPMYKSYFGWKDVQKSDLISTCQDESNKTLCEKIDNEIFHAYTHEEYIKIDKQSKEFQAFLKETKEEILDDSWF